MLNNVAANDSGLLHLRNELGRLDLMLHLQVIKFRREGNEDFKGLYISEQEIDNIILDSPKPVVDSRIIALENLLDEKSVEIEVSKRQGKKQGNFLGLPDLAEAFNLSPFEADAFLICMAPELDRKYEKLYAYLQDDVTRKQPSMSLILDLLCSTWEEKMKARKYFDADGALFRYHLIRFTEERKNEPTLSRPLAADGGIISYVSGSDGQIKEETSPAEGLSRDGLPDSSSGTYSYETLWPDETTTKMLNLIEQIKSTGIGLISLYGPYGAGKREAAKFICKGLSIGMASIDLDVLASKEIGFEAALAYALRDALLRRSAAYLSHFEVLNGPDAAKNAEYKNIIIKALEGFPGIAFIAYNEPLDLDIRLQRAHYKIELPLQSYQMRSRVWQSYLNGRFQDDQISELATKFRFTAGQIRDAAKAAQNLAVLDGRDKNSITIKDLYEGSRNQSNRKISTLARRIEARYTWEDIILPEDKIRQLKEVRNHIKHRGLVYHDWGFDGKLSLGKGLNVLFLGPSGTGKTMAAEVMSTELGLDLYKIDLSSIVSKYIGETEKNLSKIFMEAEQSNAILFFDEADALFGKRSEVKDSHDRYANVEISYLLQKMEEHEGVVIMASNLSGNIDDAFLRRMHFTIEFPFPDEVYRLRIWKSMVPKGAPLAEDIDYEFLSRKLKISGGNIKNIIVNAAFLAADDSKIIRMKHVMAATKREYQKMKMVYSQSEFGKYYDLI
jgi:ATP-dependent 26S proteasome regulatory subunit